MRTRDAFVPAEPHIEAFLTHLAVHGQVAASTQNHAINARIFLYKRVLKQELSARIDAVRAPKKLHVPVVMTREEKDRFTTCAVGSPGVIMWTPASSIRRLRRPYAGPD